MVQTGRFKKFLEMLLQLSCLELDVTLGGHGILLIGVVWFLVVIVAAGSDRDVRGCLFYPFFPPLASFSHCHERRQPEPPPH
jgi:hypothetical protein